MNKQQDNCCEKCAIYYNKRKGGLHIGCYKSFTDCPCHQPQDEWEKEVRSIGAYLGCNEGELWSEISKLLSTNFISKKHLKEVIDGMKRTEKDWDGNYSSDPAYEEGQGYNQALSDLKKELDL